MMGSGKSVTGKVLAEQMDMEFKDLDEIIEKKTGRSIAQIFKLDGEEAFRVLETRSLVEISSVKNNVIATGGGVILKQDNVGIMKDTGILIYLETSLDVLWDRVKNKQDRPLIQGEDPKLNLTLILKARKELYERISDLKVETDGKSALEVAKNIIKLVTV